MKKNKSNLDMKSNLKSKEIFCYETGYSFNHIKPFYACDKQTLQTLKIIYLETKMNSNPLLYVFK